MSDCQQCENLKAALFDAATRFRNAAETLWTDGKDKYADELASGLLEAGNAAYETGKGGQ